VQSSQGRVRVTVRLADGIEGLEMTSLRYDRELGDVFALQDEVAQAIVAAIEPAVTQAEWRRASGKPTPQLDAWESFQRGAWLLFGLRSKEELLDAVAMFRRAGELDPTFASASALEAIAQAALLTYHWADDQAATVQATLAAAERSVALAADDPWGHTALGYACFFIGQRPRSIASFERAIELNPSLTLAYQGLSGMLASERPDEAIRIMEKGIRLSPRDPQMHLFLHQLAVAHFMAGNDEEAVRWDRESLRLRADQPHVYRVLAAACGRLGRKAEALEAIGRMLQLAPHFSLEHFQRTNSAPLVERVLGGWRLAGWKE